MKKLIVFLFLFILAGVMGYAETIKKITFKPSEGSELTYQDVKEILKQYEL